VKAPSFAYAKPRSLDEVFALAERHGADAKLLAGGQTLLATLNMRLSSPQLLIDITGLPGLAGITVKGGTLRIGALTTHRTIERSPEIAKHLPRTSHSSRFATPARSAAASPTPTRPRSGRRAASRWTPRS
jgi:carbon-monoxide dehydrogenase medium subunit